MNLPKISVVMSCFNEQLFISRAIESILNQSFKDFEFIIIDDGSKDKSLEIINHYKDLDNRIVSLSNLKNEGLIYSLNKGIAASRADIIARMDADDISLPSRFEKQFKFLQENPEISILGTGAFRVNKLDEKLISVHNLSQFHDDIINTRYKKTFVYHPSVMMRKSVVVEAGGYNLKAYRCEDLDLWLRVMDKVKFHNLQEPLIRYSVSDNFNKNDFRCRFYTVFVNMKRRNELISHSHLLLIGLIRYKLRRILFLLGILKYS